MLYVNDENFFFNLQNFEIKLPYFKVLLNLFLLLFKDTKLTLILLKLLA